MKEKIKELGLAGLGLGVTMKEKVQSVGRKLVRRGAESHERKTLHALKERLRHKIPRSAKFVGKEALVISKKSLELLEKELKRLEKEAKKVKKTVKRAVKKRVRAKKKR